MSRAPCMWLPLLLLAACGGGGGTAAGRAAEPVAKAVSPALAGARAAHARFAASPRALDDFEALARAAADAAAAAAEGDPARAEAELILALGALRLLEDQWPVLADFRHGAHDLIAATALPVAFGLRPLDGEHAGDYRDRLCLGPAAPACDDILPDFWGELLADLAAERLAGRAQSLAQSCGCEARYRDELAAAARLGEQAAALDKSSWTLEKDTLARSAFAEPMLAPGAPPPRALLGGAAPDPAERGEATTLVVDARADAKATELLALGKAAHAAGYSMLALEVRSAAPPHARGWLLVALAAGKPPRGLTLLKLKRGAKLQAVVDQIDAVHGAAAGVADTGTARVVLKVK